MANPTIDLTAGIVPAPQAQPSGSNSGGVDLSAGLVPNAQTQPQGQQTNDVGNTVIVPKEGESYQDTMQRVLAYGKTVTQADIDKEMQSAPAKVAEVVAAAPVIGAGGAAALAAPGEVVQGVKAIPGITDALLQHAEQKAGEWAAQYPHLIALAGKLGIPTSTAAVLGWLYHQSKSK